MHVRSLLALSLLSSGLALPASAQPAQIGLSVEIVDGEAQLHVALPCGRAARCAPTTASLGRATSARVVHALDLLGRGFEELPDQPTARISAFGHPAALVRVTHEAAGTRSNRWVLVSLGDWRPSARRQAVTIVWDFTSDTSGPRGGGLSSRGLRMSRAASEGPLEIELRGEALPSAGDEPFRPGPPLVFRFRMAASGQYEQVR